MFSSIGFGLIGLSYGIFFLGSIEFSLDSVWYAFKIWFVVRLSKVCEVTINCTLSSFKYGYPSKID